jgi:ABC-type molybdate transport system substrate-binding protein
MTRIRQLRIGPAAIAALALAACGSSSAPGPSATPDPLSGSITVLAASSLTSAFNTAEKGLALDSPRSTRSPARKPW